jgi:hypothetical protein
MNKRELYTCAKLVGFKVNFANKKEVAAFETFIQTLGHRQSQPALFSLKMLNKLCTTRRVQAMFNACMNNRIKLQWFLKIPTIRSHRKLHTIANQLYRRKLSDIANVYFQQATKLQSKRPRRSVEFIAA